MAKKKEDGVKDDWGKLLSTQLASKENESTEEDDEKLSSLTNIIMEGLKEFDFGGVNFNFYDRHWELLLRNSFIMLFAYFDFLLLDLLQCYYSKYPNALSDEMNLSYRELRKCIDINEAKQILIDKKIESLTFTNRTEFFEKYLEGNIRDKIINWKIIKEAYQRRNILVHNDGIVDSHYIRNVIPLNEDWKVKKGDRLSVSGNYYVQINNEIIIGGIILIQNCWRKWFKDDLEKADSKLIDSVNKGLIFREFEVAKRLSQFSKGIELYDEENRDLLDILHCYSLKKLEIEGEFKKELKIIEKHELSLRCLVALAVLKDDREAFYKYVEKAAKENKIDKLEFNLYAIYQEFAEDDNFLPKLEAAFK
ncbi:hypothetical protein ACFLVB_01010 [Chloroflexota bacterium]